MVEIPAGEMELRDDRVKKKWKAEIKPFQLARYPVTVGVYGEIGWDAAVPSDGDSRLPAVNVSWLDAVKFCNLLSEREGLQPCYAMRPSGDVDWNRDADGYRLPTEAEWQYACKAGTAGYRYGELDQIAWYAENAGGKVHEVGGKEPNAWGLYDMLGNVWEWCWDLYDEEVYGPYRIFRGGSWAEEARGCGATCRRRSHPTFCIDDLGFRLARSIATR
ncbi:SUMF1/EgtB/PvdO family nonheme iron enzyme [Paenibacillus sp. DLE-14]|uniref:SUMF1/EgtB/PvdO family nonheme iron enzyme n=2 Tax=Paenibacillus lignilyticus TaxID=1172615 RepID=A0ABS5CA79_9BACL|nr:SUMF1/EgtB/PvdO family nonheme iron enzyme [Paenibacillus lignilyticus]MBP3962905.1 SUMF1/EgtB/PvdO family nonheme iron enzyme [Paenibacillus lignilyticus]